MMINAKQWASLARMEAGRAQTVRHLGVIEQQINEPAGESVS